MSTLKTALASRVSQADWDRMAEHAGVSADELKSKLITALEDFASGKRGDSPAQVVSLSDVTTDGDCQSQRFEVTLWEIIGVSGTLTLCGSSTSNWSATLQFCLVLAGSDVWCTSYTFDPGNLGVCYDINAGIATVDLCFQLQFGSSVCLNINGQACLWALGWTCSDFNVTPFCLPLP